MKALFSPDSRFMRAMSRIGDLLLLNFFYLLTCVPVITIGAASTALYTVCFRFETEREAGVIRSYFQAFRDNWKQATVLWLILLLCGGSACFNAYTFFCMTGIIRYAFILFLILFALVLLSGSYIFPLLSRFDNHTLSTLKNALALSLGHLPRSILITALNIVPFVLLLTNLYIFLQAAFIWAALYFAAAAYLNSWLLRKVFSPYLEKEEESA